MAKLMKATINSKNIELARARYNQFSSGDKTIVTIKLKKKNDPRKGNNLYEITYKPRVRAFKK